MIVEAFITQQNLFKNNVDTLVKWDFHFETEKDTVNGEDGFKIKIKTEEDGTITFQLSNKVELRTLFTDLFLMTEIFDVKIEVDWGNISLILQFL